VKRVERDILVASRGLVVVCVVATVLRPSEIVAGAFKSISGRWVRCVFGSLCGGFLDWYLVLQVVFEWCFVVEVLVAVFAQDEEVLEELAATADVGPVVDVELSGVLFVHLAFVVGVA
jgi:hypothetical protein